MPAVVTTISQPCASKGGTNQPANTLQEEVTKTGLPDAVLAGLMDNADPATLLTGTTAIVLPGPLPTVPHAANAVAHHPSSLTSLITMPPHIGTTRTLLRSLLLIVTSGHCAEGMLFTESTADGQVAFHTCLQIPSHNGTKSMTIKIDPGAQVNTIPLSKYCKLFPKKLTKSKYPKAKALLPTKHTWIAHNGLPKPFLVHFVTEVMHASEPRSYPTCFYMFEDATSPHILLSYVTSERLGFIQFNVPNLAATTHIDHVPLVTRGRLIKP